LETKVETGIGPDPAQRVLDHAEAFSRKQSLADSEHSWIPRFVTKMQSDPHERASVIEAKIGPYFVSAGGEGLLRVCAA
jgi:hypothetical protein